MLLTRSEEGMTLFSDKGAKTIPAQALEVYDVSGAGDTVIAVMATMMAMGKPLEDAMRIANRAGGIVVGKLGTATVSFEELFPNGYEDLFAGEKDGSCRSMDDCGAGSAPDGVCHAADCPLCPDAEMDEGKIPLLGGRYHFWRQFDSFPLLPADSASGGKDAAGLPKICGGSDSLL